MAENQNKKSDFGKELMKVGDVILAVGTVLPIVIGIYYTIATQNAWYLLLIMAVGVFVSWIAMEIIRTFGYMAFKLNEISSTLKAMSKPKEEPKTAEEKKEE